MKRQITAVAFVIGLMAYGSTAAQSPAPSATVGKEFAGASPLTAQQLDKMAKLAAQESPQSSISKKITDALGLTSGDQELKLDQLKTLSPTGDKRAFCRLPDGGYLLCLVPAYKGERFDFRFFFRLDGNFKLINAIVESGSPRELKTISDAEALPMLDSELKKWAGIADEIIPERHLNRNKQNPASHN